jgi:hypothetical protein
MLDRVLDSLSRALDRLGEILRKHDVAAKIGAILTFLFVSLIALLVLHAVFSAPTGHECGYVDFGSWDCP